METTMSMQFVGRVLLRRIRFIIGFAALAAAAAGLFSFVLVSPIYQASSKLIVHQAGDGSALDIGAVNLNLRLIETYKQIIRTDTVMDLVVQRHPELGATAAELVNRISVSSAPESQMITVSAQDASYARAAAIVNAVSSVFKEAIPSIMNADNVEILSEAKLSRTPAPISPRPALNIALGLVLGAIVATAVAFLLEASDGTVRSPADLEAAAAAPVLAVISETDKSDFRTRERKKNGIEEATYATIQR